MMKTNSKLFWLMGLGAILANPVAALAKAGMAEDWQLGMQDPVTPVADYIHWFYSDFLFWIISVIVIFVLGLLLYVMVRFNEKANPVPSKTTHHVGLEIAWTLIPVLILVVVAIPSLKLLYLERDIPVADMTVKVIGNPSWNWTYEYPDLGLNEDKTAKVSFTSYLLPEDQAKAQGVPYLLSTDVPVVVPVNKTVKLIVTSDPTGIIHSWAMPSFGIKIDAIPGRLNEDWFKAERTGVFHGQCSELCGKEHAFMPIEVWVVDEDKYKAWADLELKGPSAEDLQKFLATIRPSDAQVAQQ